MQLVHPGDPVPTDFDGLLLSGGGDIHPHEYGGADAKVEWERVDTVRDELEKELIKAAIAKDRPVLGICRGFQMLTVVHGGKLVGHTEGHRPENGPIVDHKIRAVPGSLLAQICGTEEFSVNSRHHQVVKVLPPGLRATATVGEFVEALEATDGRWILGVQWHPETKGDALLGEAPAVGLFREFVRAAERVPAR